MICYNEISSANLPSQIPHFLQTHDCCNIPIKPFASNAWKLFPPRLKIDSHELFIDNDLVIYRRVPEIDEFLVSNRPLCYGTKSDEKSLPPYGVFENGLSNFRMNSGIFGVWPGYDFESDILFHLKTSRITKWGVFDEQGLVATCLLHKNPIIVTTQQITNCWKTYIQGQNGCHFCGHNFCEKESWKNYFLSILI